MTTGTKYFDSQRDRDIIDAGGFFCQACTIGKPLDDRSPDPRYCLACYEYLAREAEMLPVNKKPRWIPKPEIGHKKVIPVPEVGSGILSTVSDEKTRVDKIQPSTTKTTRGRKRQELPEDLIRQLAAKGMGSKAISAWLLTQRGISANYRTIARVISGQRLIV